MKDFSTGSPHASRLQDRAAGQHRRGCPRGAGADGPSALLTVEHTGFAKTEMKSGRDTGPKSWKLALRCLQVSVVGPVLGLQGKSLLTEQGRYRCRWGLAIRRVLGTET